MKDKKQTQIGFTLIEMLVVISIVILLASLIFPAISRAIMRGQQAKCMSHLRTFGLAWNQNYLNFTANPWSDDPHHGVFPWLSSMYPEFVSDHTVFLCPSDGSRGAWGSKPAGPGESEVFRSRDTNDFPETNDPHPTLDGRYVSYMYEFSAANCDWAVGWVFKNRDGQLLSSSDLPITWGEAKMLQLNYGDRASQNQAYDRTQFPLVRCFHHYSDQPVRIRVTETNGSVSVETSFRVMNVAVGGNVFMSGLLWEAPLVQ